MLRITRLAHRRSYMIITYANSHEKLTKTEIRLVIIWSNYGLSNIIWHQYTIFAHN